MDGTKMMFNFFFITVVLFFGNTSAEERWHFTYKCINNNCARIRTVEVPDTLVFDTLSICRLTCGTYGSLWPMPTTVPKMSENFLPFSPSSIDYLFPTAQGEALEFLKNVRDLFDTNLRNQCGQDCIEEVDTSIEVYAEALNRNNEVVLLPDTNESFVLNIQTKGKKVTVGLTAPNVFGLRHGFETLGQLVATYFKTSSETTKSQNGLVILTEAEIIDKPVYQYRGLLLDTSRNWLPVKTIKKQIDAMGASKMNVFHWHATDSQSFPLNLPSASNMSKYGAYSPQETYTLEQISEIKSYAKLRGVRLLMEIDAPSHAGNGWQWTEDAGLGKLSACLNQQPWRQYCIQPPCGQLNPANENVYGVLKNIYRDLKLVLEDQEWFHMGGDEVFFPCWNATEEIVKYMEAKGWGRNLPDFLELWGEFQRKALEAFDDGASNKAQIVLWSSHLTDPSIIEKYLPKDRYIILTWVPASDPLPKDLLDKGYKLIISTKDSWYLDHGFNGITQYHTWRQAYNNKLPNYPNVLGGEVCMWGETVDEAQVDSKVWPRAAAAAERLWSNPNLRDGLAESRLYRHRERLISRGIKAEALAPEWCLQNERQCQ